MTISTTNRRAGPFTGNGVTTAFPFAFKVFADTDVVVTTVVTSTGVETTEVITSGYTVALNADQNANPGGVVNMLVAPAGTKKLVITSNVPQTQGVSITNLGGFFPTVFNNALDRAVILVQQLAEIVSRGLVVAVTSSASGSVPVQAGSFLRWNAGGTALELVTLNELAGLTAANTLVDNDMLPSTVRAPSKTAAAAADAAVAATAATTAATNLTTAKKFAIAVACALS